MAAVHQRLQSHARTRSGQVAANTTRPLQLHQQATTSSNQQAATNVPLSSPLSLFLKNVKLLELDLLPDWPGISTETFATGTASAQGQKKRIQCVEWVLFRLFSLWDPEETATKLKPFFPPLDQVQSLNLRAAILRGLEQAKKNGVLGRDAVLRKTMLDECKGERLEEVLASFSTAVLKKVVMDDVSASGEHPALALSMALENKGYKDDKSHLSALVLAHRVSIQRSRESKEEAAAKFRDFADLLGVKERGINRKREEARQREPASDAKSISEDARREMRRAVRNNWSGNERWMETLLHGDAASKADGTLNMQFDRVWRRVEQGRLGELEDEDAGLLEQLDSRVRMHKERLNKWQAYRQSMFGEQRPGGPSPSKPRQTTGGKGIDLGFGAHEDLTLGRVSPAKPAGSRRPRMDDHYASMLADLRAELAESDNEPNPLGFLQTRKRQQRRSSGVGQASASEISELSELDDDNEDDFTITQPQPRAIHNKMESPKRLPVRPRLTRPENSSGELSRTMSKSEITSAAAPSSDEETPSVQSIPSNLRANNTPIRTEPLSPEEEEETLEPPLSPTQEAADQILESMNNVSPSPSKRSKPRHTLSLADRTRLSMAPRGSSVFLEDDDLEPDLTMAGTSTRDSTIPTDVDTKTIVEEEPVDLASRTRKSMAGFEKARQKAQLDRRRSQRRSKVPPRREGSYFPKLDEGAEQSALAEDLMAEEDMEAVFQSRPKIKASPLPSPTKELEFDD